MKKYAFLINPAAGKVKKFNVSELIKAESEKYNVHTELFFTERPRHATDLSAKLTTGTEYDYIIAVGGDGTVNEVINGFNLDSEKIFGLLPFGSGNDVARPLFKSKNYFETLFNPHKHSISNYDVGSCKIINQDENKSERKFINAVGIGFDAYVAYLNQTGKKLTGVLSYVVAVLKALKSLTPFDAKIQFESKIVQGKFIVITIGNGRTSGGGFYLNPDADPTDGILDITTVDVAKKMKVVLNLPYALIDKFKKVDIAKFYKTNEVDVQLEQPYYVHLDGEVVSKEAKKLRISFEQSKLKVITEK